MKSETGGSRRVTVRKSGFTYVIVALCALELLCAVLALVLPWGLDASGNEIKSSLEGLLPWFMFIPILLQLGFLLVEVRVLQGLYMLSNFIIAVFVVGVHYLTCLKYEGGFEPGFYFVFLGAGLAIIAGVVCLVEGRAFPGLRAAGRADIVPVGIRKTKRAP
ncbi:MAG: hypothetical protein KKF66_06660 [Actinobacteria bacterium]|nr:hypothetical protein [Actinomycetota bacterium]